MCMLHGVTFAHVEATPICGLEKSSSLKPTARSMEREGVCLKPSTTSRECSRGSTDAVRAGFSGVREARTPSELRREDAPEEPVFFAVTVYLAGVSRLV